MENQTARTFNKRAFATLMIAFSGILLPITGLATHATAHGPMSFARHVWMTAHNVLGIIFLISAICHLIINRDAFFRYIKRKTAAAELSKVSREAQVAAAIIGVTLFIGLMHTFIAR